MSDDTNTTEEQKTIKFTDIPSGQNSITVASRFPADDSQAEQDRRADGLNQVLEQFVKHGDTYRYKDVPDVVAFTETDERISTDLDNDNVAIAMSQVAQAKGWQHYMVKGSFLFYSMVEQKTKEFADEREQLQNEQQQAESQPEQQAGEPETPVTTAAPEVPAATEAPETPKPAAEAKPKPARMTNTVGAETVDTEADDNEQARREALANAVNEQYRVTGSKYYFKDQAGHVNQLAFKTTKAKLSTALNSERVTNSLVDLAESKGWTSIKVVGHKEFKRQVWRTANERGIEVRGYKPDEQDLAAISDKALRNSIQPVAKPEKTADRAPTTSSDYQAPQQGQAQQKASRDVSGKLLEHGPAPYQNNTGNKQSYYVNIDTGDEQRTVWGVDLQRAIDESGANVGDSVNLAYKGREPVTVTTKVKNEKGQMVETEIDTVRNTWAVDLEERREVITAVASAVAAKHVPNENDRQRIAEAVQQRMDSQGNELPQVQMYDNNAAQPAVVEPAKARTKAPELIR